MSSLFEIKVIVKTPAQKTEDQTIKCNLDWTVLKLKKYISENFPSKPNVKDQRLIYSGHLLKDENNLKEVFQPIEQDDTTFTVHLVLSQKDVSNETNKNQNSSNSANETSALSNSLNQSIPNFSNVNISQFGFNLNDPSFDYASLYAQQMQNYQQMYVNYMTHFLTNNNLEPSQPSTSSAANLPMSPMILNPLFFNPLFAMPTNLASLTPLIQNNLNNANNTDSSNSSGQQAANNQTVNERLNDNQAQLNNENDVDNQNNGIIDMMNIFWNILILFSLISASLSRTFFVMGVCFLYYLFQTGFFSSIYVRFLGDQALNNRNQLINEEHIQQMMDEPADVLRRRNADTNNNNLNDADADINNNQPQSHFMMDKFRFFWMIISSLFSSLMPNNGPIVPAN